MEESILTSTKKILGLDEAYTVFDLDIITHINAAFTILHQLGVGPPEGYSIEDKTPRWSDFTLVDGTETSIHLVKTYIYLKVRSLFDPPTTSFLIEATEKQIEQAEWRLNVAREEAVHPLEEEVNP